MHVNENKLVYFIFFNELDESFGIDNAKLNLNRV